MFRPNSPTDAQPQAQANSQGSGLGTAASESPRADSQLGNLQRLAVLLERSHTLDRRAELTDKRLDLLGVKKTLYVAAAWLSANGHPLDLLAPLQDLLTAESDYLALQGWLLDHPQLAAHAGFQLLLAQVAACARPSAQPACAVCRGDPPQLWLAPGAMHCAAHAADLHAAADAASSHATDTAADLQAAARACCAEPYSPHRAYWWREPGGPARF